MINELIQRFFNDEITDQYVYSESAFSGIMICYLDVDRNKIFGYYFKPKNEGVDKDFFFTDVLHDEEKDNHYIIINKEKYYLCDFMKI